MESVLNGERTTVEVSDLLEINLEVIDRVAARMTEQLLGLPASPPDPDDLIDYFAPRMWFISMDIAAAWVPSGCARSSPSWWSGRWRWCAATAAGTWSSPATG